jgi:DNA-binding NarL/FixJ family response regulator
MLKILLVEDHAPFRRLIRTELQRRQEFQIIEAADGLEAIKRAEEFQPDLILLDVNLPGLPGFEVARQVRRIAPDAWILFLSQESSPEIVRRALSLGVDGYIQKLSAGTDLLPAIEAVRAGRSFVSRSVALHEPAAAAVSRRHEMLFCSDDAAVVDAFARNVADALKRADAAIVLATEPHRTELLHALRTQGIDIDGAVQRGTCRFLDANIVLDAVRFLEGINDARTAAQAGKAQPRVTFCGERAGRLWAAGRTAEAIQLEQLCGELPQDVDIFCLYPVPYTNDDQALTHICAEHTAVSAC